MSTKTIEPAESAAHSPQPMSVNSANSSVSSSVPAESSRESLLAALVSDKPKKQFQAIRELAALGESGELALVEFLRDRMDEQNPDEPTAVHGSAYQHIFNSTGEAAKAFVEEFPEGLVCPQSDKGIDYSELQMLLIRQDYQAADKLTQQKLCQLAGESAVERKWLYFTEISQFPIIDLQAIDAIWSLYSEDKFGWRKQQELWMRLGQNWESLWSQLLWKKDNGVWTRYPNEFIWDVAKAPVAHLPLSNQLRGVRAMDSLLSHPAWNR
jgi:hypothetical protein